MQATAGDRRTRGTFEIDFEMGGRLVEMRGRDLMTLEKRDGRWWLVADMFAPAPG
jgi:hypothetical protein